MTDPIGQDAYKGLGVPLFGESVIRQQNSSNAILTLMHSTANTGRLLMGMDYKDLDFDPSSLLTDLVVFDIHADGGYQLVSGTSLGVRLNSSGLYNSTNAIIINTSGESPAGVQQTVTISSDGSTAVFLTAANSGKVHIVSTNIASSIVLSLPTTNQTGIAAGMYWDVMMNSSVVDQLNIASIGVDKVSIQMHNTSATIVTTVAITNKTSGACWLRIMCDTTGETGLYTVHNFMGANGSTNTASSYYGWEEGSSALTP